MSLSLDGRVFIPVENSAGGVVDARTEFHFSQTNSSFRATYTGGDILGGHIIGQITAPLTADLLYHCETTEGVLKAGRAAAIFDHEADGSLTMSLDWEWVSGGTGSGISKYIEINQP